MIGTNEPSKEELKIIQLASVGLAIKKLGRYDLMNDYINDPYISINYKEVITIQLENVEAAEEILEIVKLVKSYNDIKYYFNDEMIYKFDYLDYLMKQNDIMLKDYIELHNEYYKRYIKEILYFYEKFKQNICPCSWSKDDQLLVRTVCNGYIKNECSKCNKKTYTDS